jgi:hypothetical protein
MRTASIIFLSFVLTFSGAQVSFDNCLSFPLYLTCTPRLKSADDGEVSLEVYFESLCPDSVAWLAEQLKPTHDELGHYMKVDYVPFGKAFVRASKCISRLLNVKAQR